MRQEQFDRPIWGARMVGDAIPSGRLPGKITNVHVDLSFLLQANINVGGSVLVDVRTQVVLFGQVRGLLDRVALVAAGLAPSAFATAVFRSDRYQHVRLRRLFLLCFFLAASCFDNRLRLSWSLHDRRG